MNEIAALELPLVAYVHLPGTPPGFALPLFGISDKPCLCAIQEVDELTNKVAIFKLLEGDVTRRVPVGRGVVSRVGTEIIHVFVTRDGVAHAGTINDLQEFLRDTARQLTAHPAVLLQIMELLGNQEEKLSARRGMLQAIAEASRSDSVTSVWERSMMRSVLWDRLRASARDGPAAERILRARRWIDIKIDDAGRVVLDLPRLDPGDFSGTDVDRLALELQNEFQPLASPGPEPLTQARLPPVQKVGRPELPGVKLVSSDVAGLRKQEERIAYVLRICVENPNLATMVLKEYR